MKTISLDQHACLGWAANISGQIRPLGLYENYEKSVEYFYLMPRITIMRASIALGKSFFSLQTQQNPLLPVFEGAKPLILKAFGDGNMVRLRVLGDAVECRLQTFCLCVAGKAMQPL